MSKKKILIFIVFASIITSVLLFKANLNNNEQSKSAEKIFGSKAKDAIPVAMILPLQGQYSALGESALKGARFAVELINNEGGILGHKIELIVGDSRSSTSLAAELSREFVSKGHKIIIGGIYHEETLSILDQIKDSNFFYLSDGPALTCKKEDPLKLNNNVWGLGITPQMQTETFLISLSDKFRQPERTFDIYLYGNSGQEYIADYLKEVSQGLEFKIIGEDFVDLRINDLFQRIRGIFDFHPDLLIFFTTDVGTEKFMSHAHKLSLRTEMTVATINSINQEQALKLGELADGVWTTTTYSSEIKSDTNVKFIKSWKEYFKDNSEPSSTALKSYSALKLIQEALIKNGDAKITNLEKGLNDLEVILPQGGVSLSTENHLLLQPLYLSQIDKGKFSKLELIGEVSHPALEGCSFPEEKEVKRKPLEIPEDY